MRQLQRTQAHMDPGNSVCLDYSITAVPWLEISAALLKINLFDHRCDETSIQKTHLSWSHFDTIILCTGVHFPFLLKVVSWLQKFWQEASEASNVRITRPPVALDSTCPSVACCEDKHCIWTVSERVAQAWSLICLCWIATVDLTCQIIPSTSKMHYVLA